ncbi:MAG: DinB family protein [Chitinophagales bacterium]
MTAQNLAELFERDLLKLKEEISLYTEEKSMWIVKNGIHNSAGNLCLHLLGNLNHFIGATLGHSGYVRQRELEFSKKDIPRTQLLFEIDEVTALVKETLQKLTPSDLEKQYPLLKHEQVVSTEQMLLHLFSHLSYHLGQINYHRRLL